MKLNKLTALFFLLCCCTAAHADEGMWMINAIDRAVHANMKARGCKLKPGEIYNADAEGADISDAIVSLDFECTGSIISHGSLVITNHHCAYADVHALSTPEKNYLEDGFWAGSQAEEMPVPGKRMLLLKRVLDVTEEMNEMLEGGLKGKLFAMRTASSRFEKKYAAEGEEAYLSSMWKGSRYYLAIYRVYKDIRLVAAPPVSIAAYGGDIDNWEWPQHKCDFSVYRIYAAPDGSPAGYSQENVPLKSEKKLDISRKGFRKGDFSMVIGFPGKTNRYNSSAKTSYERYVKLPAETDVRRDILDLLDKWMDSDPVIRLKYSNKYFGLSNACELYEGEILCYDRFKVLDEARSRERELQQWIDSKPETAQKWGGLLGSLDSAYKATNPVEWQLEYFRESVIRTTQLYSAATRIKSLSRPKTDPETVKSYIRDFWNELDYGVEKDLLGLSVRTFYSSVDSSYWSDFHKELFKRFDGNTDALSEHLWNSSSLTDSIRIRKFLNSDDPAYCLSEDLTGYFTALPFSDFSGAVKKAWDGVPTADLEKEYTHALYQMNIEKGRAQYPDANSTMRLTYGTIGGFSPKDGVWCDYKTTPAGILEKYNPEDYDFNLKPEWKDLVEQCREDLCVDFISDNDITGGNSGSPVLNARGEIIGLAFDGNKESLAGDVSFTPNYNKCVCTDIRFVLWTLEHYAGQHWIIDEIFN